MKVAILPLSSGGKKLAEKVVKEAQNVLLLQKQQTVAETLKENWSRYDGFVCIMAAGIVVRAIAPLLRDKTEDPCVLVMDEKGRHVVSLLSGHLGGGNQLAQQIAQITSGSAVITTASDTLGLVALDIWAKEQNLTANNRNIFTKASSQLVNNGSLQLFCDVKVESLPKGLIKTDRRDDAELIISNKKTAMANDHIPVLHPRNLVVGVGCNRGTPVNEFEEALSELFEELGLTRHSVRNLASIDVKNDEIGLIDFANNNSWPIKFYGREEINTVEKDVTVSRAALKAVGAVGVAEPTALLSANTNILLSRKRKWQNITMAVAEAPFTLSAQDLAHSNT